MSLCEGVKWILYVSSIKYVTRMNIVWLSGHDHFISKEAACQMLLYKKQEHVHFFFFF